MGKISIKNTSKIVVTPFTWTKVKDGRFFIDTDKVARALRDLKIERTKAKEDAI